MKIKQKLLLSYLILIALFVAAGATITYNAVKINQLQTNVKQQENINDNAYNFQQGLDQKQFGTLMYSASEEQEATPIIINAANLEEQSQNYLTSALQTDPTLLTQFNNVLTIDNGTINPAIAQIIETYNNNDLNSTQKFTEIWDQMSGVMNATSEANLQLAAIRTGTQSNVQNAEVSSQNYITFSIMVAVAFTAAIAAVSVALTVVMGKQIATPLKKLANVAQKVSQGDLDQRYYLKQNTDSKHGDEIDELVEAFKKMVNSFRVQEALLKEDEGKDTK